MKHLKQYEYWTTSQTGNFDINYDDKKERLSDTVKFVMQYIVDNFDNITEIRFPEKNNDFIIKINFINDEIKEISLYTIRIGYSLFFDMNGKHIEIDITDIEFEKLNDLINKVVKKRRFNRQKNDRDELLNVIDPLKRDAKKYNL